MFHVFMLAACLTAHANAGYTSYFYSGFPGAYPAAPVSPTLQYHQPAPVAYQSFVPYHHQQQQQQQQQYYVPQVQAYSAPAFPSFPANGFGHQHTFPQQFVYHTASAVQAQPEVVTPATTSNVATSTTSGPNEPTTTTAAPPQAEETTPEYDEVEQDEESVITNAAFRSSSTPQPQAPVFERTQNIDVSGDNFRGFGYRNEFEGGSSHFVFITGPEAYRYQQAGQHNQQPETSHSASDSVDTVATGTRSSTTNDHSLDALIQYLEHPQVGVQRFYSVNNALVTRRLEDEIPALPSLPTHQYPTTTLPFTQPISPLFPLLRSSFQLDVETVKPVENKNEENEKDELNEEKEEVKEIESDDEHEESASTIEAKSVKPESESTSTLPISTTTEEMLKEASSTTVEASSTTTTTEKVVVETSTQEAEKEETSSMEPIVVE